MSIEGCGRATRLLVGLHEVGIVGLREAMQKAEQSGRIGREEIVDFLVAELARHNYLPPSREELYREALWREYLRLRGEDFHEFYSGLDVVVRGDPGEERDEFLRRVAAALASYELRPIPRYEPADPEGPNPQLVIDGEAVVQGCVPEADLKREIKKHVSHW